MPQHDRLRQIPVDHIDLHLQIHQAMQQAAAAAKGGAIARGYRLAIADVMAKLAGVGNDHEAATPLLTDRLDTLMNEISTLHASPAETGRTELTDPMERMADNVGVPRAMLAVDPAPDAADSCDPGARIDKQMDDLAGLLQNPCYRVQRATCPRCQMQTQIARPGESYQCPGCDTTISIPPLPGQTITLPPGTTVSPPPRRPLAYLASPYTGNEDERDGMVRVLAGRLLEAGHHVLSPISHSHAIATHPDVELPGDFDWWEDYDRNLIDRCDELWVATFAGWATSRGVTREIGYAKRIGKPVVFLVSDVDTPWSGRCRDYPSHTVLPVPHLDLTTGQQLESQLAGMELKAEFVPTSPAVPSREAT
jgi:nucleoside 2-deoxyribosyltransferase